MKESSDSNDYGDKTVRCPPPGGLYLDGDEERLLLDALEFYRHSLLGIEAQKAMPELSAVASLATSRVAMLEEKIRSQR